MVDRKLLVPALVLTLVLTGCASNDESSTSASVASTNTQVQDTAKNATSTAKDSNGTNSKTGKSVVSSDTTKNITGSVSRAIVAPEDTANSGGVAGTSSSNSSSVSSASSASSKLAISRLNDKLSGSGISEVIKKPVTLPDIEATNQNSSKEAPLPKATVQVDPNLTTISSIAELKEDIIRTIKIRQSDYSVVYTGEYKTLGVQLKSLISELQGEQTYEAYGIESYNSSVVKIDEDRAYVICSFNFREDKNQSDYVDKQVKTIVGFIVKEGSSEGLKELAIHDWLVANMKYDKSEAYNSAYSAITEHRGNSDAYALLLHRLFKGAGLDSIIINGKYNGSSHIWNLVKVDGLWYHIDSSLDDNTGDTAEISHSYFNITDGEMREDHRWDSSIYTKSCNTKFDTEDLIKQAEK